MNLTPTPSLISQAATSVAESPGAVQVLALRKALQLEQQGALALLNALPQPVPPVTGDLPLAREGALGTQLNVMA